MQLSEFVRTRVEDAVNGVLASGAPQLKPGYKTTEFGTTSSLMALFCYQAYQTGELQWAYLAAGLAAVYVVARTFVKRS